MPATNQLAMARKAQVAPAEIASRIQEAVSCVIEGKQEVIRLLLTALFARGHVLLEDVPGVGKTTLARALAAAVGGSFKRVQFTSDLLPADILGVSVFKADSGEFQFRPGPIFANIVLADEINRSSPRTQSALMEALNEGQVSIDDQTHELADPFMLLATQNPVEQYGTYPLPESQLDRFLLRLSVGYPAPEDERRLILRRGGYDAVTEVSPVVTLDEILAVQRLVDEVRAEPPLLDYLTAVVQRTRQSPLVELGVSTRGAIAWFRAAQALALVNGRDYCVPDDVKSLAAPVLAHRLLLAQDGAAMGSEREASERVLQEILEQVSVPI